MTMKENEFNVLTAKLEGTSLIEASAGTGKTYSVAILVLRMILEKEIPVEKILMVTFTKAAAGELESRIRSFIRKAYKFLCGKINLEPDNPIRQATEIGNRSKEEKSVLMGKAVGSLDSLSVMTIHSFCQQTINEFTFETNQSFDFEIITDDSELLLNASDRYLREVLNILNIDTFRELYAELKFEKMHELLKKHLLGMKFIDYDEQSDAEIEELKANIIIRKKELEDFVEESFPLVLEAPMKANALRKEAEDRNVEEFIRRFRDQLKKPAGYFISFNFMTDEFREHDDRIKQAEDAFINYSYFDFFRHASKEVESIKSARGYISYNDQIRTVHSALENNTLKSKLKEKYKAVFIDEFQDTDRYQYRIFKTIFSEDQDNTDNDTVVFYIGDPKQSIYGWRGADLDTYKTAGEDVGDEKILRMNKNFRSTGNMIEALNFLLGQKEKENLFLDDDIAYYNVDAGAIDLGKMEYQGKEVNPVTFWKFDTNDERNNFRAVAREIYYLLTKEYTIKREKVRPGDIGVLVRSNKEGDKIKRALAKFNIPAVKRDDKNVFDSDEAIQIQYLIKAVLEPSGGAINRALLSSLFGFTAVSMAEGEYPEGNKPTDIRKSDTDRNITIFTGLRQVLKEDGIYNMISSFLTAYGIRSRCMKNVLGQRTLTNINQIAEILHKVEKKNKYTPEELLIWIQRRTGVEAEDFEQRIESDEDAVQISTIHKAKGLEYNIVFAPCLCMIPQPKFLEKNNVNTFRKENEYWFTFNYPGLSEEDRKLHDLQKEQENRRLIYVTLTRPVYKAFISVIPRVSNRQEIESSLDELVRDIDNFKSPLFNVVDFTRQRITPVKGDYRPTENEEARFYARELSEKPDIRNTFGIHSYSALCKAHHSAPFEKAELGAGEDYDQFIFQDLGRGANVGIALHSVFERLDFSNEATWEKAILDASKYYSTIIHGENREKNTESNLAHFRKLVDHVMKTRISIDGEEFHLTEIHIGDRLPELGFFFTVNRVSRSEVDRYLGEDARLGGDSNIEGLMTGSIDLLFRHKGKYYIIDWKSNHLGNTPDFYDREGMEQAMTDSNYHLQYMIYTVAAVRWLKTRIPDFDYEKHFGGVAYIFLRGVRQGMNTGIYGKRPEEKLIVDLDKAFRGELQEV